MKTFTRGLTLLEGIVIVVAIAFHIALLLPSIYLQGEAVRGSQCRNNLKQVGLALHLYHDAHKVFPPGITSWDVAGSKEPRNYVTRSPSCGRSEYNRGKRQITGSRGVCNPITSFLD